MTIRTFGTLPDWNASYALTICCTSLWRTTSRSSKWTNAMPSTCDTTFIASTSPETRPVGRSICVTSPVTTALDPKPSRVRNIFICSAVVFCASSRITNESLSVRPRMNASGAISTVPRSSSRSTRSVSSMS